MIPLINRDPFERALSSLDSKLCTGNPISVARFISLLRNALESDDIQITHNVNRNVDCNVPNINGFYDSVADAMDEQYIELEIITNPDEIELIFKSEIWTWIKNLYVDSIVHEYIHHFQSISRKYTEQRIVSKREIIGESTDYFEDILYYGDCDEIGAYAINAASELMRSSLNKKSALYLLKHPQLITFQLSTTMMTYINMLKPNEKLFKRFIKAVVFYLEEIDKDY